MTDRQPPVDPTDEVAFRTSVLVELGKIGVDLAYVKTTVADTKTALADHVRHDNERFGKVDLRIGDNTSGISKGTGIVIAVVAMIGVIMWIIDRLQP